MASISPISFIKPLDASQAIDQYSLGQKQALIDALKQSAINPQAPQQYGAIASRTSPITPIVQAISAMLAKSKQDSLNDSVRGMYQNQYSQLQGMMGGGQPQQQPTQDMMGSLKAAESQGIAPDQAQPIQAPQVTPQPPQQQQQNQPSALGRIVQALSGNKPPVQAPSVQPVQPGNAQMNPFGMDPALATSAYMQDSKGYMDKLIDFYAKKNAPVDSQHTIEGMTFNPGSGKYADADGKQLTDAQVQARLHSSAGLQHSLEGLVFDPRTGRYTDADGKQLTAKEVTQQIAAVTGAKASATTAAKGSAFGSAEGDLLASMAEHGISLPAGLRSKDQQVATLRSLIARSPGLDSDQIVEKIRTGQLDFGAEKKFTTTAAATGGRVAVAQNEINEFAPLVLDASAKVPRGSFVPITRLMQTADTALSDPNLKQLKISINSMLNAYDMLAARGGTDAKKREEAHSLLLSAESPEALAAGIQMFQQESDAAERAAQKAMKGSGTSASKGQKAGDVEQGHRFKGGDPADPNSWEKV